MDYNLFGNKQEKKTRITLGIIMEHPTMILLKMFTFVLLFAIGLMTTVNGAAVGRRRCSDSSNCVSSYEFCDSASGFCANCTSYPCHPSTIKQQGTGMCRRLCQDYWHAKTATKGHSLVIQTESPWITSLTEPEDQDHEWGTNEYLLTTLVVLVAIAVGGIIVLTTVYKWEKIKMYLEKLGPCGLRAPVEEEGVPVNDNGGNDLDPNQQEMAQLNQ